MPGRWVDGPQRVQAVRKRGSINRVDLPWARQASFWRPAAKRTEGGLKNKVMRTLGKKRGNERTRRSGSHFLDLTIPLPVLLSPIYLLARVVEKVLVERFEIVGKTQDLKTVAITYRPDLQLSLVALSLTRNDLLKVCVT